MQAWTEILRNFLMNCKRNDSYPYCSWKMNCIYCLLYSILYWASPSLPPYYLALSLFRGVVSTASRACRPHVVLFVLHSWDLGFEKRVLHGSKTLAISWHNGITGNPVFNCYFLKIVLPPLCFYFWEFIYCLFIN